MISHEKQVFSCFSSAVVKTSSLSRAFLSLKVSKSGFDIKATESKSAFTSDGAPEKISAILEKNNVPRSTFPNGFEELILNVCDETSIAELKLKVGAFQMHLKRDVGNPTSSISTSPAIAIASPTIAPPIPSEPMDQSAPLTKPTELKNLSPSPSSDNPFANVASSKAAKLAALEADGAKSYVLVSSPTVGTFRSGRTIKGKKQLPSCKEGDMIKEGQIIGYVDQFGNELPIRSDTAGEILKILFRDGEAVGYGDPLVAVLPSFHGIR